MRFIELQDGLSIRIDEIEAIVKIDDLTSEVRTESNTYVANFPYDVLLRLIEEESRVVEEKPVNAMEQYWTG